MLTIKILGSGCANCKQLDQLVAKALDQLHLEAETIKVTDPVEYSQYDVLTTPGLVINERTVSSGRVPSLAEVSRFVEAAQATT